MMDLVSGLKDKELRAIVASATEDNKLDESWDALLARLDHRRFVLPVMGVQGSGKSTLLTALCFNHLVLPVDADETTAVPVEISWAADGNESAEVHFKDGHFCTCPPSAKALAEYVHQEHNPGNRKGVRHVVVRSLASFLQNGLVLVDLPGLGSLTEANRQTTVDFLKEATGILYLLRTNPTLTDSEAKDLKSHWASIRNLFLAQNKWSDESIEEIEESMEFNSDRIKEMAKSLHRNPASVPDIVMVDAYTALKGRLTPDSKLMDRSSLPKLEQLMRQLGSDWPQRLHTEILKAFLSNLSGAVEALKKTINSLSLNRKEAEADIEAAYKQKKADQEKLDDTFTEVSRIFKRFREKVGSEARKWIETERPVLRSYMLDLLRKDVTDSRRLNDAFQEHADEAFEHLQHDIQILHEDLLSEIAKVAQSDPDAKLNLGDGKFTDKIHGEDDFKFRNFSTAGGTSLGAVLPFLIMNPGGWIAMAVAGAAGALLGGFLGGKTKETLLEKKISELEPAINTHIDSFLNTTQSRVVENVRTQTREMKERQDAVLEQTRKKIQAAYLNDRENLDKSAEEKKQLCAAKDRELSLVKQWLDGVKK